MNARQRPDDGMWWRFPCAVAALMFAFGLTGIANGYDFPLCFLAAYVVADLTAPEAT